jgi:hypothetical protein
MPFITPWATAAAVPLALPATTAQQLGGRRGRGRFLRKESCQCRDAERRLPPGQDAAQPFQPLHRPPAQGCLVATGDASGLFPIAAFQVAEHHRLAQWRRQLHQGRVDLLAQFAGITGGALGLHLGGGLLAAGTPAAGADHPAGAVSGHLDQPAGQAVRHRARLLGQDQEGRLGGVLGVGGVAGQALAGAQHHRAVAGNDLGKIGGRARRGVPGDEVGVGTGALDPSGHPRSPLSDADGGRVR